MSTQNSSFGRLKENLNQSMLYCRHEMGKMPSSLNDHALKAHRLFGD